MPILILIATLGGYHPIVTFAVNDPIVTFAVNDLLARGEERADVYRSHLSSQQPRIHHALTTLLNEFTKSATKATLAGWPITSLPSTLGHGCAGWGKRSMGWGWWGSAEVMRGVGGGDEEKR